MRDKQTTETRLLSAIKNSLPDLGKLLDEINAERVYADLVYRFYHTSFKVYRIQAETLKIVGALQALLPDVALNVTFMAIVSGGTGRQFKDEDNAHWDEITRPMLEAFFHAKYFLEMVCRYGEELKKPPQMLPSGWATVLYLYGLR